MSISTLIGSRLLSGLAAFALTGSLVGATALAAQPDNPVREIRHEVRDQSKSQREDIKQLRAEFAAEYAKDNPDVRELERLRAEIEAKRTEISGLRFAALMRMHDQLDAEQRARMAEKLNGHGHGKGKPDGKGKPESKGKPDGKGKSDVAARSKGKPESKGKPDGKGKPEGKGKSKAPI